jgi:hypothetical protein
MKFTSMEHTSKKLKKSKLLSGLICVLKENYKNFQKQNLKVKPYYRNIMQILWKLKLVWSKHVNLLIVLILEENYRSTTYLKYSYTHFFPKVLIQKLARDFVRSV